MSRSLDNDTVVLSIDGQEILCHKSETVLEAAHRQGVQLTFSCRNGVCQSCMLRVLEGKPSALSQKGLKSTLTAQGYFLACQHKLTEDMTVSLDNISSQFSRVSVMSNDSLSSDVHRIRLSLPEGSRYRAGQFINLRKESGEIRSYSLADVSESAGLLELHVRLIPMGIVSTWLCKKLRVGDSVEITKARGDCFYHLKEKQRQSPILLMGTGTGLAPLYGIINSAIKKQHGGEIFFYHGATRKDKLYLVDEMLALEARETNFHYVPCVSHEKGSYGLREGQAHNVALEDIKELSEFLVFSCGEPEMVRSSKRRAYLQGASMQNIFGDSFERASAFAVSPIAT